MDNRLDLVTGVVLDVSFSEEQNRPAQMIRCLQYDTRKQYAEISFVDSGSPFRVPSDAALVLEYRRQDGVKGESEEDYHLNDDRTTGKIYIPCRARSVEGIAECNIRIATPDGRVLHTPSFWLLVQKAESVDYSNASERSIISTQLERHTDAEGKKILRVRLVSPHQIPNGATLDLYRQYRRHGASYWRRIEDAAGEDDTQKLGYGLLAGTESAEAQVMYPVVPDWMPNGGWLKTVYALTGDDTALGYVDIDLQSALLPLVKPVPTIDHGLSMVQGGFVGCSMGKSLKFRVRVCGADGEPIDLPGNCIRVGIAHKTHPDWKLLDEKTRKLNMSAVYISID